MRRYIVLLLITGILWAQTDFDILVVKDGTTYLGEYSKTEGKIVFFKPQGAFAFQPIPVKRIRRLELKDGQIIIDGGHVKKNSLSLEEYQKLSTKEKAIYDAKSKGLNKWALYMPMSTMFFGGFAGLYYLMGGEFWESPIFSGGSSAASFYITYLVFNNNEKFNFPKSILTDSEKEIYKQAYSKKLKQRKIKYAVGSFVGTVIVVNLIFMGGGMSGFGSWGGLNCGPPCGGSIDIDYP